MSVTFRVKNSPRHEVTHTYGNPGDVDYEEMKCMEDILPTCNFANTNAYRIAMLIGIGEEDWDYVGEWPVDQLDNIRWQVRDQLCICRDSNLHRLFLLHTVIDAAMQFGQPVIWS